MNAPKFYLSSGTLSSARPSEVVHTWIMTALRYDNSTDPFDFSPEIMDLYNDTYYSRKGVEKAMVRVRLLSEGLIG